MALSQRFLTTYAVVVTLASGVLLLTAARAPKVQTLDELTVQRLNLVEPDGTLKLVLSNRARFPGYVIKNKEVAPNPGRGPGFIFFDDDGSEVGGHQWRGAQKDGNAHGMTHMSFDRDHGDQILNLDAGSDSDGAQHARVRINESTEGIEKMIAEDARLRALPEAQMQAEIDKIGFKLTRRVDLGRELDGTAALRLADAKGRDRARIIVAADGAPSIELLDEAGKVVKRIAP